MVSMFVSFLSKHFLPSSVPGAAEIQRTASPNPSFEGAFNTVAETKHVHLK